MKPIQSIFTLISLLSLFLLYNFFVYTDQSIYGSVRLTEKALQGENIWLKNNCNSCHQLYGLGGYLGPDLTNIYSTRKKDETYLKSMLTSGIKNMPRFNFNESEKEELIQFLKEIDQTGHYPNVNATINADGWVEIQYKKIFHAN